MGAPDQKAPSTTRYNEAPVFTTSSGCPVFNPEASAQIGTQGPLLLDNHAMIDSFAHFNRERIPERVVHAKGAGAFGEFTVTDDISDLTDVDMLNKVGKTTKCVARFSTVGGEKGSADTARDPRGFSVKFYTEEGNWDWVFNNTPVFFLRQPALFVPFIHTQKVRPDTGRKDPTMFWDYLSSHQESIHQVMVLFSDRGTPRGYPSMNGYSGHTYVFNKGDSFRYVQIHLKTDQGIKNFTHEEAVKMAGENPDFATQDLWDDIEKGKNPSWTAYVQVLEPEQAEKFRWNIFDLTKVWPHKDVPLRRFGKLTLNQNPRTFFSDIEQVAFSPSHVVPGVEPSVDPVLQSRLFAYPDAHRARIGVNYQQIPVNCPLNAFAPWQRDGAMAVNGNYGSNPNYPSTFRPMTYSKRGKGGESHETWTGKAVNFAQDVTDEDYVQATGLWNVLGKEPGQQDNFVNNVAGHLSGARVEVRKRTYGMFSKVDKTLGQRIEKATEAQVPKEESARL